MSQAGDIEMSPSPSEESGEIPSSPCSPSYSTVWSNINNNKNNDSSKNPSLKEQSIKNNIRYKITDLPPYKIIITGKDGNINNLHPIAIGRMLFKQNVPNPTCFKKISRNNILATFPSSKEANAFLDNDISKLKLNCYIPYNAISKQGIIKSIPLEISEEEIKQNIKSHYEILSVRRLNRRVQTEEGGSSKVSYVPSRSVLLTFRSNRLPDKVYLYSNSITVSQYQQPITQCKNCLRYGHTLKNCKAKTKRCPACHEDHDLIDCAHKDSPVCLFCKGNHLSNDRGCIEKRIQLDARQLASNENILLAEALKIKRTEIRKSSNNPKPIPDHGNSSANPLPLPSLERPPTTRRITEYHSYASVTNNNNRKRPRVNNPSFNRREMENELFFSKGQANYTYDNVAKSNNNQETETAQEPDVMETLLNNLESLTKKIDQNTNTKIAERILTILGNLIVKLNDGLKNNSDKR